MNINELKTLIRGALLNEQVPGVNFAETKQVVVEELMKSMGINPEMSYKQMKRNLDFSIVEEVIAELLPKKLEDVMGQWANIKQFGRDEEVIYTIKGLGKRRAMYGISYGARGGIYKARRLDEKSMSLTTKVYTCAVYVTLEEILLGKYTLADLMNNILEGMQYVIYTEVVKALRAIKNFAPAANQAKAAGFVAEDMDRLIRIVGAYGKPVIVCFDSFAAKINNLISWPGATPNVSGQDIEEYRQRGSISMYKGTPVVKLPNFLMDEDNSKWAFKEEDAFILPADEKPVIVALKGEGYIKEVEHPTGSVEQNFHQILGVGMLMYNNLGIYTDTNIEANKDDEGNSLYGFEYKF